MSVETQRVSVEQLESRVLPPDPANVRSVRPFASNGYGRRILIVCSTFKMPYRVLRCAQAEGTVYVLGAPRSQGLKRSRYCKKFISTNVPIDGTMRGELAEAINEQVVALNVDLVLAGDAAGTRSLIAIRDRICAQCFLMPDLQQFDALNDKWQFYEICKSLGIQTPDSRFFQTAVELRAALDNSELVLPQIAKPLSRDSGEGCIVIGAANKEQQLSKIDYAPILVQDFIEGDDIGASVFCEKGEVKGFVAHKYRRGVYQTFIDETIRSELGRIARNFQIDGIFNFDMRLTHDHVVYYLECNPRVYFKIAMSMIAGINFVSLGVRGQYAEQPEICPPATVRFPKALLLALLQPWKIEPESWSALKFVLSDPAPHLRKELGIENIATR